MQDDAYHAEMQKVLREQGMWTGIYWSRRKSGEIYPQEITLNAIRNDLGEIVQYCSIFSDITEHYHEEEKLRLLSSTDGLTGLTNRRVFDEALETEWRRARRLGYTLTIIMADIDNFKKNNDTFGHVEGDECLKKVAQTLKNSLQRAGDLAARYGGEEFTLLLPMAKEGQSATQTKNLGDEERRKLFKENEDSFLESLIDMRLQLQEARNLGIDVNQHEITETIDNIQKKYSMTQADFTESLKKEGLSLKEYKKRLSEQILINKVVTYQIRNKIIVSDAEVNRYMEANKETLTGSETYKLKQIFLKKPEGTDRQAVEEKAAEITRRLKDGENFSSLARIYSEDPSARLGGDLGFVKKDLLAKEFVDVLSGLNAGDYSVPFWTDTGLHIIRLDEKVSAQNTIKVKEDIRKHLAEEHFSEKYRDWIKGVREKAYIEILL